MLPIGRKGSPRGEKRQHDAMNTNNIQYVAHASFGSLRIYRSNYPFICATDLTVALGHADPHEALLGVRDKHKTSLGSLLGVEDDKERAMVFV
jgi:prophage antirepressor-like protein